MRGFNKFANSCFCIRSTLVCILFFFSNSTHATTPIEIWHTFQGVSAEVFLDLVNRFNQQQNEIRVNLKSYGDEEQTVQAAIQLSKAKNKLPHLLQVRDDLGEKILRAKISKPLRGVFSLTQGDTGWFIPNVPGFLRDVHGRPYAYPLAAQIPILFYNKDAWANVALDPDTPPKTWFELQHIALKLAQAGAKCPYTTSYQSWIFLENLSSWHDEPFLKEVRRGHPTLAFNALLQVRHIALMNSWVVSDLLKISGDNAEGDVSFASGECLMLTSGSAALGTIITQKKINASVAFLPYYEEAPKRAWRTLIAGDSLWIMDGKTKEEYKAVAKFLAYFSQPEIAAEWHQRTGYLPITNAAFTLTQQSGYYKNWPRLENLVRNVAIHIPPSVKHLQLSQFSRLRQIINQHLNLTWAQRKPPKQALDDAVREGNKILKDN